MAMGTTAVSELWQICHSQYSIFSDMKRDQTKAKQEEICGMDSASNEIEFDKP
jgi:hypothetical protein